MTDVHAAAVLAIYQAGIDEGNATFETCSPGWPAFTAARLPRLRPRHISDVQDDGDLVVTVCDLAREELGHQAAVHWSVPDPVPAGDPVSFDAAVAELSHRVERLAPRLDPAS